MILAENWGVGDDEIEGKYATSRTTIEIIMRDDEQTKDEFLDIDGNKRKKIKFIADDLFDMVWLLFVWISIFISMNR